MKNILLLFAVTGILFACSKDDDQKEQSLKEIVEVEKLKVDQDSINNLLIGTWEERSDNKTRNRIIVSKNRFVLQELQTGNPKPVTAFDTYSYFYAYNENYLNVYQVVNLTNIDKDRAQSVIFKLVNGNLHLSPIYYIYYSEGYRPNNFKNLDETNSVVLTKIN